MRRRFSKPTCRLLNCRPTTLLPSARIQGRSRRPKAVPLIYLCVLSGDGWVFQRLFWTLHTLFKAPHQG